MLSQVQFYNIYSQLEKKNVSINGCVINHKKIAYLIRTLDAGISGQLLVGLMFKIRPFTLQTQAIPHALCGSSACYKFGKYFHS